MRLCKVRSINILKMKRPNLFSPRLLILLGFPLSLFLVHQLVHQMGSVTSVAQLSLWPCPLKFLTGWNCPTCGLTRSLIAAWSGDLSQSYSYHFAGPLLLAAAWITYFAALLDQLSTCKTLLLRIFKQPLWYWTVRIGLVAYVVWGFLLRHPMES